MKKLTTKKFIEKARKIHGNKYNYSKSIYINTYSKIIILCPIHKEFKQTPKMHMQGQGCPICGKLKGTKNKTYTNEKFIKKANKIHNNKYDYSKCNYISGIKKIIITCKLHGEFFQTGAAHLRGNGCKKCGYESHTKNTDYFIEKAKQKHNNKYDYSKSIYINANKKIIIICPNHGEFTQKPQSHLTGHNCPKCAKNNRIQIVTKSKEKFINQCIKIHGYRYDYSKVNYINGTTKITIICPEHGEFLQSPSSHLAGYNCPRCKKESIGEKIINNWLEQHNISFIRQATFNDCKGTKNRKLPFDFYLPHPYNIIIEYDGVQHFKPTYTQKIFERTQKNDNIKNAYCLEKNIDLIRIPYKKFYKIHNILEKNIISVNMTNLLDILS